MATKNIITVFGATGNQGGSVVQTFLNDSKLKDAWAVRGVSRDTSKDGSKKLAAQGADMVSADLNDKASLVQAMTGAYAVFAVTNYWETMDDKLEIQQGKNLADAAKEAGVQLFIWSSLYNVTKLSKGALSKVHHFDSKATVEEYVRELGIPAGFFLPGFYMTNIPGSMFRPAADGAWTLGMPMPRTAPIPMYAPADTGKYVKAMVLRRDEVLGRRVLAATAYQTGDDIVAGFRRAFPAAGATARHEDVPRDAFFAGMRGRGTPEFVIEEIWENLRLMPDFGYFGGDSLDWSLGLLEDELTTWEQVAKEAPAFAGLN